MPLGSIPYCVEVNAVQTGYMLKWGLFLSFFLLAAACFSAMGVRRNALEELLLILLAMLGVALLIAWPFLRKRNPR